MARFACVGATEHKPLNPNDCIAQRAWRASDVLFWSRTCNLDTFPHMTEADSRGNVSTTPRSQRERLEALLAEKGIARLREIRRDGITAATVSRLEKAGIVRRLGRGLYQLAAAKLEPHHSLAEAAKRVPKGVICLTSALAFHGLTDQMPRRVWIAIGGKDWKPQTDNPPLRVVYYGPRYLSGGVEKHNIEGVWVPIFTVPKTLADLFRFTRLIGTDVAVPAMKEALRQRKATPAQIAHWARETGTWKMVRPYLEALTADA